VFVGMRVAQHMNVRNPAQPVRSALSRQASAATSATRTFACPPAVAAVMRQERVVNRYRGPGLASGSAVGGITVNRL